MTLANTCHSTIAWAAEPPSRQPHSVLVLCASEERCNEIAWLLRLSGYRPSIVPDVPSAKLFLAQRQPALIVGDLRLSSGDGAASLVVDLRAHYAGALVLIMGERSLSLPELPPGVCGCLSRPLDAGRFLALVHRAIVQAGGQPPVERVRAPGD